MCGRLGLIILTTVSLGCLRAVGSQTERPVTAEVEWVLMHSGGYDDGLVERFVTRTAGDSILQSNFGNEQGFHELAFKHMPPPGTPPENLSRYIWPRENSAGTQNSLIHGDQLWELNSDRPVSGFVKERGTLGAHMPVDFAKIGRAPAFFPHAANPLHIPDDMYEGFESGDSRTGFRQGHRTLETTYGDDAVVWYFDDRRGGEVIQAEFYRDSELRYASETDLQEIDGRWFPSAVRFYKDALREPYKAIEVKQATFNEPWHQQEIGPEDLGALYGTQFWTGRQQYWGGAGLIGQEEYDELLYLYDILPDPRVLEGLAQSIDRTPDEYVAYIRAMGVRIRQAYMAEHDEAPWLISLKTDEKDPWDVYVEEFIAKHKLPEPAIERAKKVLETAKGLRDAQRRKNRKTLREAEQKHDQRRLDEFKKREEEIFREMLVKRLETLADQAKKLAPKAAESSPGEE